MMTDVNPLDIPAATAGTTRAAPVYRYLMQQPDHWLRQAFFVGRPKLPVSRVIEAMRANGQSLENAAQDWSLPVEALEEALDYCGRFHDVIEADETDELALSAELARSHQPNPKPDLIPDEAMQPLALEEAERRIRKCEENADIAISALARVEESIPSYKNPEYFLMKRLFVSLKHGLFEIACEDTESVASRVVPEQRHRLNPAILRKRGREKSEFKAALERLDREQESA